MSVRSQQPVRLVMTLMVRDEADIIAAMIEHHLAQGVDLIMVTDNGSVDGTREILAEYEAKGVVVLQDYLQHDKNQTGVVSSMAGRAFVEHGATWVINADADEFFVPRDRSLTLRQVFENVPTSWGAFSVPVVNLTGAPATTGSGLRRLTWRDERDEDSLMSTVALHAHPTDVVVHVGKADVVVQQGNHGVDIESQGSPPPELAIEVLHLPWRSYQQYATKIDNTGRSYERNPTLRPSPRHHGMRDFRFLRAGVLEDLYIARHRLEDEPGFSHDPWLAESLVDLVRDGRAVLPHHLAALLEGDGEPYGPDRVEQARAVTRVVVPLEIEQLAAATAWRDAYRAEARKARKLRGRVKKLEEELSTARAPQDSTFRRAARRVRGRQS